MRRRALLLAALALAGPLAAQPAGTPSAAPTVPAAPVTAGADRLFGEYAHLIRGRRLALVTNHTGRLADGTHLADALHRWPHARLRVLFGMEYDVRSNDYSAPRDPEAAVDGSTGLPKYSLYGATHKPTPEMLGDAEVVVWDVQDVGARFYEHVNVLAFVMEAAAERGLTVVVLDRPNPLTGLRPDGFVADSAAWYRFGSYAALPALHGMTPGELARYYNGERLLRGGRAARLHVVPMRGWRRAMWFDQTGLAWRKPSPNLLTLDALVAYAGTCLFEALNVSEGRGTPAPFQTVGAPWLDHARAAELLRGLALPGVAFDTVTVTPAPQPFMSRPPEMAGERVRAVRLRVTDRHRVRPYRVGVALLWAVHRLHADRLVWNEAALDRLAATPRLRAMLEAGHTPQEIAGAWAPEVAAFVRRSAPYRLYE